jgi:hypothetical protein
MVVLGGFKGVLDLIFAIASVAYGLRRLRRLYTGFCIRVKRSSDNAQLDIGFDSQGNLDILALLAFVGTGSGFVTIWYDQSGNGRNATQTTAANQPQIVANGVLQTEGGKPAVLFDGADDGLASPAWGVIAQPFSRHYVGVRKSFATISHWINSADGIPNTAQYDDNSIQHKMYAGSAIPVPLTNNERAVLSAVYNGAASVFAKNGSLNTGNPGTAGFNGVRIGSLNNTNSFCANVAIQELIVVASESVISTTDRQTLERNQGGYYGITVA